VAVVEGLLARGAQVDYADPRVPWLEAGGGKLAALPWEGVDLGAYDLVVVLTAHPEFAPARIVGEARLVLDTRNATAPAGRHPHVRVL
jgi:UDP-N-acetyl-D-mannosaminuronate dehydrogenase